jgi:hypothetical protein
VPLLSSGGGGTRDTQPEEKMSEGKKEYDVIVGWVHPGKVHTMFMDCMLRSIAYDVASNSNRIVGWNAVQCSANVSGGRNALADWFLDETAASWLMMIDTDMTWDPQAIHELLASADPVERPVVGGLCFSQDGDTGRIWPTLFTLVDDEGSAGFARFDTWPDGAMVPVSSTGAAFLLVHRSVFEKIREDAYSVAYPFFMEQELNGKRVGEDTTFCFRAARSGFKTVVNTAIQIGHIKEHVVTLGGYIEQLSAGVVAVDETVSDAPEAGAEWGDENE